MGVMKFAQARNHAHQADVDREDQQSGSRDENRW
jgi:hypothetical protein